MPNSTGPDWTRPIALDTEAGKISARPSGLDLDGKGKGEIGVNIYTKRFMTPFQRKAGGWSDEDPGVDHEWVDERTGTCRYGRIVNVPSELLPDHIEPATGKIRLVTELEARRREQDAAARAASGENDPVTSEHVTVERNSGHRDELGAVTV